MTLVNIITRVDISAHLSDTAKQIYAAIFNGSKQHHIDCASLRTVWKGGCKTDAKKLVGNGVKARRSE